MAEIPLAQKEVTENLSDEDYIVVAKADETIRKVQVSVLKTHIVSDILGGEW